MTRFPVLERHFPVLERPFLLCPVLSRGTGQDRLSKSHTIPSRPASHPGFWQAVLARPGPWQDFEIVPLSLWPWTMRELLSLCPEKLHCPVPLKTLLPTPQISRPPAGSAVTYLPSRAATYIHWPPHTYEIPSFSRRPYTSDVS